MTTDERLAQYIQRGRAENGSLSFNIPTLRVLRTRTRRTWPPRTRRTNLMPCGASMRGDFAPNGRSSSRDAPLSHHRQGRRCAAGRRSAKKARFPRGNPNGRILHGIEILDDTTIAVIIAKPPLPHTLDVAANIMRRED